MHGAKLKDFHFKPYLDGYAIKVPVFSFDKFPNVDKSLGPEMKSTGEAIYFIELGTYEIWGAKLHIGLG